MGNVRRLTNMRPAPRFRPGSRIPSRDRRDSASLASGARGEGGAVLILALVFLIVVGGVVGVLANSISSHLEDTGAFAAGRSLQYEATSAVDLAIQNIRYTPLISSGETLDASPPVQCWNPDPGTAYSSGDPKAAQLGGIDVWCSTVWNASSANTRTVTISACQNAVNGSAGPCAASPLVQAVVVFDDYPPGVSAPTTGICSVYCGSGETIESWSWSPIVPAVTDLRTADGSSGGPITGGTTVYLTGTGFVQGATTVNFTQESGGAPSLVSALQPVTPTSITPISGNRELLQVNSPAVTSGTTFWVTVTTPNGTTAACLSGGSCFTFTYTTTSVTPIVTALSVSHVTPPKGSTNGGDLITISGSGFYTGAQVNFIPEGAGNTVSATDVIVFPGGAQITAVTPGVIAGSQYLVQVVTPGGSSATSTATTEYTYVLLVPLVSGIGPNSVSTSTSYTQSTVGAPLALVGASFFTGATVQFQPQSCSFGYGNVYASSVTVHSPSLITTTVPGGLDATNCTYQVVVTEGSYSSSNAIAFSL